MLAQTSPQLGKAVGVLKELSADEQTRMLFEARENERRDWASRMGGARRDGRKDVALKLLKRNSPITEIMEDTGLTHEEIEALMTSVE